MIDVLAHFFVIAVTVEALVEYAKSIGEAVKNKEYYGVGLQGAAIVIAIGLAAMCRLDVYGLLGVTFALPVVGYVLTGIFASRGANYASDIIGKLRMAASKDGNAYESDVYITEEDELTALKEKCDKLGIPYTKNSTVKSLTAKINAKLKED